MDWNDNANHKDVDHHKAIDSIHNDNVDDKNI
jgi:hypothetical protein